MYLVDTNIVSEARKGPRANAGVRAFFHEADPGQLYIAVQTIGEIRCGLEKIRRRGDRQQTQALEHWLDGLLAGYADRILDFDGDCAQIWGKLMSLHPQHPIDQQIAAIALIHDLTIVTRNTADFAATGVRVQNPFN